MSIGAGIHYTYCSNRSRQEIMDVHQKIKDSCPIDQSNAYYNGIILESILTNGAKTELAQIRNIFGQNPTMGKFNETKCYEAFKLLTKFIDGDIRLAELG